MKNKNNIKVSVVVCTYNHRGTIEKTINSILAQDWKCSYEIIIADDDSNDGAKEFITAYMSNINCNKKIILRNKNTGGGINFIEALEAADGEYIAYCEGDDYWINPLKTDIQLLRLEENHSIDLVWTDINIWDDLEKKWINSVFRSGHLKRFNTAAEYLINKAFSAPSTWMFRRNLVPLIRAIVDRKYIDGTFPLIVELMQSRKIEYIDEVTAVYTKHQNSSTNTSNLYKRYLFARSIFDIQIDLVERYNFGERVRKIIIKRELKRLIILAILFKDKEYINLKNSQYKSILLKTVGIILSNGICRSMIALYYKKRHKFIAEI